MCLMCSAVTRALEALKELSVDINLPLSVPIFLQSFLVDIRTIRDTKNNAGYHFWN